ncbi:MAG: hypothetical protein H0U63_01315 [Burkholderiales bacterium]|nr:hypothetical protein [Burkholderiales bacterium]
MTHIIYALHTASLVIGVTTAVAIITAFIFGIPSIIAVILNYMKQSEVRGTYLESHFRWQIRTFWFGVMWFVIGWVLVFTLIGIPFALLVFGVLGLWFIYRIARGWLRLKDKEPMYG